MKRGFCFALILAVCLVTAPRLVGQVPADANGNAGRQDQPAQKPAPGSNPFPEDTSTVPVMPTKDEPDQPAVDEGARAPLPSPDVDPARSPDDPAPAATGEESGFSSSLTGLDKVVPMPDSDKPQRKPGKKQPTHQEAAAEDVQVGQYYLSTRNWKAALSRFQSAMVLDPENPEVYWGLAEADRHLNDFVDARLYYQKLLEYDPDGPHGKEARKAMKDPQIANAQKPSQAKTSAVPQN